MAYYKNQQQQQPQANGGYVDPYAPRDMYGNLIPPQGQQPQVDQYGRVIPPPQVDQYGRVIPPQQVDQYGRVIPPQQVDQYGRVIPPPPAQTQPVGKGNYYTPPARGRGAAQPAPQYQIPPQQPQPQQQQPQTLQGQQSTKPGFPYFTEPELQQDLAGCHSKMNDAIKATLKKYPNEGPLWYEVDKLDIEFSLRRNNGLLAEKLPPKPLTQSTTPGARGDFNEYRDGNGIYLRQFGYDDAYVNAFNNLGKDGVTARTFSGTNTVSENLSLGDETYGASDLVPAKEVPIKDPSLETAVKQSEYEIVLGSQVEEPKASPTTANTVEPSLETASLAVDFAFVPNNIEEMVVQPNEQDNDFTRCKVSGVYIDMRTGETREDKAASLGIPLSAFNHLLHKTDKVTADDKRNIGINKKFSSNFIVAFNRLMDEVRVVRGDAPYVPPVKPSETEKVVDNVKEELLQQMRIAFKEFQKDAAEEIENLARLNKTLTERLDKAVTIITDMKEAFEEAKRIVKGGHTTDSTTSEDTSFTVVDDKVTVNDYQRRRYTMIKALPQSEDSTTLITTKSKEPKVENITQLIKVMAEDFDTLSLDFREYIDGALIPLRKEKDIKEFLGSMSDDDVEDLRLTLNSIITIEHDDNDKLFCTIHRRNVLMVTQDKSLVSQVYEMKQGEINELANPIAKFIKATVSEKGEQLMNYGPIVLYVGQHKCIVNLSMTGSTIVRAK